MSDDQMTRPPLPPTWGDYAATAAAGLALALAFPDYHLWPLAWVAVAPLLARLMGREPRHGARLGFVFGLTYFGPTLAWLSNTMINFGHMAVWLSFLVNGLGIAYMAMFTAFFGWAVAWMGRRVGDGLALACAPFLWVAVELARMYVPPAQFPWARIADSQYLFLQFIQIADLGGEELAGLIILLANAALAAVILWGRGQWGGFPWVWAATASAILAASLAYGHVRMGQYARVEGKPVPVALLQGNIDQARKWDPAYRREQAKLYLSMTLEASSRGAKLVVWPETAAPYFFGKDPYFDGYIKDVAQTAKIYLFFGAPDWETDGEREISYNSAWLVSPDGSAEKYDKVHLAPFGEYVPLPRLFFFVQRIAHAVGDLTPGKEARTLDTPAYKLGPQICFEIIFPSYSAQLASMGAGALVNITNDSWFGFSPASRQSLSMAVFRAVENRTPLLRAAQSGVSAIVNADGRIAGQTPLLVKTALDGSFVPRQGPPTLYSLYGWLLRALFAATAAGMLAWGWGRGCEPPRPA